jgi:hypothetical protein
LTALTWLDKVNLLSSTTLKSMKDFMQLHK